MYLLVIRQSRRGGWRILSCRSIQKMVWSEMSFLMTVLSQSKTAYGCTRGGRPSGQLHRPRSSMARWISSALSPYQRRVLCSWGQRAAAACPVTDAVAPTPAPAVAVGATPVSVVAARVRVRPVIMSPRLRAVRIVFPPEVVLRPWHTRTGHRHQVSATTCAGSSWSTSTGRRRDR